MSLNYVPVLTAVMNRLATGDAVITANIGKIESVPCVFVEQADPLADTTKPTLVIARVSQPSTGTFTQDQVELNFDVHLFYGKKFSPYETGSDIGALMDAVRSRLNRWAPTASGMVCSTIWNTNSITTDDDDSWHRVSTFAVHCTEA